MSVDPRIRDLLLTSDPDAPGFESMTVEQVRAAVSGMREVCGPGLSVAEVRDVPVPTSDDSRHLAARLYHPSPGQVLPLLVFFFGGGFVAGDLDVIDTPVRQVAVLGEVAVLSVAYRLAPEHPYPAAAQDAEEALRWAMAHAGELGADGHRVGVGGESSGAALATRAAVRVRDVTPSLTGQVLIYPVLDVDFDTESYRSHAEGFLLTRAGMRRFWNDYLAGRTDAPPPGAVPAHEADVTGLPRTLLAVSEHDPLRSEGVAYAARLAAAGVDTELREWAGMTHASWYFDAVSPAAARLNQDLARAIGRLLRRV